jgi:hypothetical protein
VGVESDDEMLCLWLDDGEAGFDVESLKDELPEGIEIVSAKISMTKKVPEPSSARYVIKVKGTDKGISERIAEILASKEIAVERPFDFAQGRQSGKSPKAKMVDVRPFLGSIRMQAGDVVVDCKVSPAGTIRVDEILGLLQLGVADLAQAVRRTGVQWGDLNGGCGI